MNDRQAAPAAYRVRSPSGYPPTSESDGRKTALTKRGLRVGGHMHRRRALDIDK